jgi:glycosyltransferase involved in cell wall biosynthesis
MRPGVSVVIPSYNSAAYLPEAIDSALNQTVAPLEVIVVNDGSTDETPQILERYRGRLVVITQENRGLSGARNSGIAAASGELIAFLDADDVWLPEKLEKQVACLAEHPRAGLVHSAAHWWNPETGERSIRSNGNPHQVAGACYKEFFAYNRVTVSTIVVPQECLAQVGNFDEEIRRPTTQDYDLCIRIARHYELAYVDEPLVLYRLHTSNASNQLLPIWEDALYVLRKALQDDASLRRTVGRAAVNDRLFEVFFQIGRLYHDAGQPAAARRHFLQALRHRPSCGLAWSLYLRNFLPRPWVQALKQWKRSAAPQSRSCSP